ncbi:MAG: tripartite tricarboxylate transporter TctB family protein [Hyphomicrobiaceae bacterium]
MSFRVAEFVMAAVMALFSGYLMWKSAELPIGWIKGEGPGGGMWPFWLSAIMLVSCIGILVNWARRATWPSRSNELFFAPGVLGSVAPVAIALAVTIALFSFAGAYLALFAFLMFYLKVLGGYRFASSLLASLAIPVVTFFFFEIALKIILPKGFTEPFFLPIFKWFGMGGL